MPRNEGGTGAESSVSDGGSRSERRSPDATNLVGVVAGAVAAVATVVAVVIGYLEWVQPHAPAGGGSAAGASAGSPPGSTGLPPTTPAASTGAPVAGRYLTELPPSAGAANAERPAGSQGVLRIHCATGESDDQRRSVQYNLLAGYTELTARAAVSGPIRPESRAQVEILADTSLVENKVFRPGTTVDLRAALSGAGQLTVRVTCEDPAGVVTLSQASLRPQS